MTWKYNDLLASYGLGLAITAAIMLLVKQSASLLYGDQVIPGAMAVSEPFRFYMIALGTFPALTISSLIYEKLRQRHLEHNQQHARW